MAKITKKKALLEPLWKDNQILVAILGICSALAVTIQMKTALVMALAVIFVTGLSCFFVSLVRKVMPDSVRMIAQLVIISTFVIIVDQFLQAYFFNISRMLSVFVGLIITNCLVMGRCESFARNEAPLLALLDGVGAATGYGMVIIAVSFIRELFGFGTIFGFQVIPEIIYATAEHSSRYVNCNLMALAPSAFFIIGLFIWIYNSLAAQK
ncbi:MAG: Na(+)-translocating NADH-quinone reductase subunit D [Chlamydiia bacterium]|nr:Na(+)-translocating NADH-quinone reductase subunit D [Chlamydiia bacterium]MCH9624534.1 Na(+)-translocating NADH-quinone reductase subunit D [Chlamydiia bacterium]